MEYYVRVQYVNKGTEWVEINSCMHGGCPATTFTIVLYYFLEVVGRKVLESPFKWRSHLVREQDTGVDRAVMDQLRKDDMLAATMSSHNLQKVGTVAATMSSYIIETAACIDTN